MAVSLAGDVAVILLLTIAVMFLFIRFRIPAVAGLLLTGILTGPHGLRVIDATSEVGVIAEVGIVLLLFTIGMEFSFRTLFLMKRAVLAGGAFQVGLTLAGTFLAAKLFGLSAPEALFAGFLVSLSSTAIVLKALQDRAELDSLHGRTTLSVLIFQDIIVVPMILFTPLIAGRQDADYGDLGLLLLKAGGIIALVIAGARWLVPALLYQVTRTRSRELFLLTVVALCVGVAWLTHAAGLSFALGAFLAGLVVSESEYSHQALGNILPLRDVFTSFFFITIGMLLDVRSFLGNPLLIVGIAAGVIIMKALLAASASLALGISARASVLIGFSLCQIGEFSFILSREGLANGLLSADSNQLFLSVSILTMMAAPLLISLAPSVAEALDRLPLPGRLRNGLYAPAGAGGEAAPSDHIIIIGFGINGRNVARAAAIAAIPLVVIEMNPDTVRQERRKGVRILYGDATQEAVLESAGIRRARVLVIAIADPGGTRRITAEARRLNPSIDIIARTRYLQEMEDLYRLGATQVIPEEFETSVEIFSQVLKRYLIPLDEIRRFVQEIRSDGYGIFRELTGISAECTDLKCYMPGVEIAALRVGEESPLAGKTLSKVDMRRQYEVVILAVRRGSSVITNPAGDLEILPGDVLVALGPPEKNALLSGLLFPVKE